MQGPATLSTSDYIKSHHTAWSSGDSGRIGLLMKIVGGSLCEAVDLRSCDNVLDIATGDGGTSLAVTPKFAATSIDYVPKLPKSGLPRAEADGQTVQIRAADAENLPFEDDEFDVALSTFGVMFAPNQQRAAAELLRLVKPGGRIGLANWISDGFFGELFRVVGPIAPPPAAVASPATWGTEARLVELFGPHASEVHTARKKYVFHYLSAHHWIDVFRLYYGPVRRVFEATGASGQKALHEALVRLLEKFNRGGREALIVPADYVQVVIRRAGAARLRQVHPQGICRVPAKETV